MTEDKIITVDAVAMKPDAKPSVTKPVKAPSPVLYLVSFLSLLLALASLLPWFVPTIGQHLPLARTIAENQLVLREEVTAIPLPASSPVVEQPVPPEPQPTVDVSGIMQKFDSLQAQLFTVNTAVSAQAQRLDAQQEMAGTIKNQSVAAALNAMQPLLTLQTIRNKLDNGSAYTNELESLKDAVTDAEHPALDKLAKGGMALSALADSIDKQSRTLAAAYREEVAVTWWEKIKARISSLIYIKTAGTADDTITVSLDTLVSQVRHGDDKAALATLETLPGSVKSMLADQQEQLQAHHQAVETIDAIGTRLAMPAVVE